MKSVMGEILVIAGMMESASVYAHSGDHHGFGIGSGFLHLISEPTHLFVLIPIVLLLSVFVFTVLHHR